MVGVPGKSKGCSTCRRRKKGCDQKRPICGQCLASGYVCGGYERELTFVIHPASKTVETAVFLPTKLRSLPSTAPPLQLSTIVTQCQNLFFDIYLPHGRCVVKDPFMLKCGRAADWTSVMRNLSPKETSLELAFAALSISRVGRNKNDPQLIKESTRFYGQALKTLQKALYDPSRMYSEQVLTACLLLGLYESFEGAGGTSVSWVSHAQGAARIIELRGPEQHADLPAHTLFLGTRLPITYAAILRRRKTVLNNYEWLTVPWRSQIKTGLDRLIDVLTHIPELLEQFDTARSQLSSNDQRQALQSCLSFCHRLLKSLATWNTIRRPNSLPIAVRHVTEGQPDSYPFTQELTFENFLFLNANLVLWSAGLVISTTVSEIECLLAGLGFRSPSTFYQNQNAIQRAQECAENIAQSIPYCLWPEMGDVGIDYVQFPMCLALQFFMKSNNSRVCSWIMEKTRDMQKNNSPNTAPRQSHVAQFADGGLGLGLFATAVSPTSSQRGDDYDFDSDNETQTLKSGATEISDASSSNHRQRLGEPYKSKTDSLSEEPDDFAFVQENPAKYYIDRTEVDTP